MLIMIHSSRILYLSSVSFSYFLFGLMPNLLTSFWTFSLSTWFFSPDYLIEALVLPLVLSFNKKPVNKPFKFLLILFIVYTFNYIIFKNPLVILLFIGGLSCIPLLHIILTTKFSKEGVNPYMQPLLKILHHIGFLDVILFWYSYFNVKLSLKSFKYLTSFFALMNIMYIFCAKDVFYLKITHTSYSFYWIFLLSLLSLGLLLRLLTAFSFIFVPFLFQHYKNCFEDSEIPDNKKVPLTPQNNIALFTGGFNNNHHHKHYYPPEILKSKWLVYLGYSLGFASVIIGGVSCYQYSIANKIAEAGNKLAERQYYEITRKNDLECLRQGFMSKETYCSKYSSDSVCKDYFKTLQTPEQLLALLVSFKKTHILNNNIKIMQVLKASMMSGNKGILEPLLKTSQTKSIINDPFKKEEKVKKPTSFKVPESSLINKNIPRDPEEQMKETENETQINKSLKENIKHANIQNNKKVV